MKFIKQLDSMQCGVACLKMVSDEFNGNYSYDELSELCSITSEGVSMLGIYKVAKQIGLNPTCTKIPLSHLTPSSLPCILHWHQKHFVVLYKITGNRNFYIADPSKGLIKYNKDNIEKHWLSTETEGKGNGIALFFQPTDHFYSKKFEKRNIVKKHSFKFLIGYLIQYKKYFMQIFLGLMLNSILLLIMPFLTQAIVDIGITHKDIGFIWLILLGELMIVIGRTTTDFIRRWLLLHISMRINISLVSDFFIKLLKLPMSFFDTKLMGDLMQRIGDHSRVQSFLTNQILSIMFSVLSFVILGFVLFIYNKIIFGVFFIGSIIYGLWIATFLARRKVIDYELFEQQAINQNKTYQFITSMQEIKLQDCEQRRRWEWEDTQVDLFDVQMKSLKLQQTQEAGSIFINEIKNILITVLAATSVITGNITLGAMLAIQYIVGQLNSPIEQLMSFVYSLQDVKISLERINEIHLSKNEESMDSQYCQFKGAKKIDFTEVDFKYNLHAKNNTLNNISFSIPEGKVTAIVGASGSGKTTLIKLMLGYYKVNSGFITISENDIIEYNLKWWRKHCGVVMQDGFIFSESIARNIAIDENEIDIEQLNKAANIACIHDYVMSLPLKYNTKIGRDGLGLSQGQKQRILIARAVYKNPDFIFLDEATNALDANNERAIVENLNAFYQGRTVVVVAHRLSTVKNADQIVVLDKGNIIEVGTHNNLIYNRGTYYNLVKNQLELGN